MSLKKKYLKSKPVCKVTFSIPEGVIVDAKNVNLLGEFNDWTPTKAESMRKLKDGSYTRTLDLEKGKNYQFRYLIDGEVWFNDTEADSFISSGVGAEENCVVEV